MTPSMSGSATSAPSLSASQTSSDSVSPSISPAPPSSSPSPSVEPIYQMRVGSTLGLCVSEGCVETSPYDAFTTRISLVFERAIPEHLDGFDQTIPADIYTVDTYDLINVDLS